MYTFGEVSTAKMDTSTVHLNEDVKNPLRGILSLHEDVHPLEDVHRTLTTPSV
jgi:hypothetical protein